MNRKTLNEELNRLSKEDFSSIVKIPVIVVLDNIRSLNNIGSVFRTSDAFAIECIYLCGITATPPHREIYKTALGAEETVEWKYFENTQLAIESLRTQGYKTFAVEQAEQKIMLDQFNQQHPDLSLKLALVFGNEVDGVAQDIVDACYGCIEIPQFGTKHSFNISVSVGIVLWEISKRYMDQH